MFVNKLSRSMLFAVTVAAAATLAGCGEDKAAQGQAQQVRATPVDVQTVKLEPALMREELTGRTTAYRVAEVRPQVTGIVQKRLFTEGADVKEGQSLYQIDPATYNAALQAARATLQQARATLVSVKADAERSAQLVQSNAVSHSANDAAQAAYLVAKANVSAAEASVTSAAINVAYTQVKSPITGKVSLSEVTPGALVTANQSARLTVVQQLDPIYVDVTQSYAKLAELKAQMSKGKLASAGSADAEVRLIMNDGSFYPETGKLTFKDALVDETTGTVRLRVEFPNSRMDLMPGMYVRAQVINGVRADAVKLDQRATMRRNNGAPYVFVVGKDNKVESRDIVIAGADGDKWIVESGLKNGDNVIVNGIQKVRVGAPVVFGTQAGAPAAAPAKSAQ